MRLHYGLGCGRAHSVRAIAREFAMTPEVIGGILMEAQRRLAKSGLQPDHLRAAADDTQDSGTLLARRERRRNRIATSSDMTAPPSAICFTASISRPGGVCLSRYPQAPAQIA